MLLIFADIHFGKSDAGTEREKERSLIDCIDFFSAEADPPLGEVVLLGDVFEYFIEYRHLIPKGFARFLGRLGQLSDDGVDIAYFAGNHDPWHIDYFETEFGAEFHPDVQLRTLEGRRYHFFHGDGAPALGGLYGRVKWLLRHPLPVSIYKSILPGDAGVALARWVNKHFAASSRSMETVDGLRSHAASVLESTDADVVVLGHSHYPEFTKLKNGLYLNPGSWHHQRTFAVITETGPRLMKWTPTGPLDISERAAEASEGAEAANPSQARTVRADGVSSGASTGTASAIRP